MDNRPGSLPQLEGKTLLGTQFSCHPEPAKRGEGPRFYNRVWPRCSVPPVYSRCSCGEVEIIARWSAISALLFHKVNPVLGRDLGDARHVGTAGSGEFLSALTDEDIETGGRA